MFKVFFSGLVGAFCETIRERFATPRLSTLHTADELMKVVNGLMSEHGGGGVAFPYAKRALELEPDHRGANDFMADYCLRHGEFSQALIHIDRVIQLGPDSVFNHLTRGDVLKKLGRLQDALGEYETVLTLSPSSPGAWTMHGEILSALGRHTEAADSYARRLALKANPSDTGSNRYVRDPEAAVAFGKELYLSSRTQDALEVWQEVANIVNVYPPTKKEAERLLTAARKKQR